MLVPNDLRRDADSHPRINVGHDAHLSREWATYARGQRFRVIHLAPCVGGDVLRYNAKAVDPGGDPGDPRQLRTLPAELLVPAWVVGDTFELDANQGLRPARVLAVLGTQALVDYEMPAGKVFLRVCDALGGRDRSVSQARLPAKWQAALAASSQASEIDS